MSWRSANRGFTLVELMVVLMIIAVLIAIAMPMFIGVRVRAQESAAQSDLRTSLSAAKVYFADSEVYDEDSAAMSAIEPSLTWVNGDTPLAASRVYIHVHDPPLVHALFLSIEAANGICFYIRDIPSTGSTQFASDSGCAIADTQTYAADW